MAKFSPLPLVSRPGVIVEIARDQGATRPGDIS
jgi:hypothetical protein